MRFRTSRGLGPILLLLVISGFIGWKSALYTVRDQLTEPVAVSPMDQAAQPLNLGLFNDVLSILETYYVDPTDLDREKELYGAVKGLVNSLGDPYTVFMTPTETVDFQQNLEGTLQGIGAELTMRNDLLTVIAPLKGSPAETAGLKPGDVIYKVDDKMVADLSLFEAIMAIRGAEDTSVRLTIVRGKQDPIELTIQRAKITLPSVELEFLGDEESIAHLTISQFNDQTQMEFDKKVQEILLKNVKGIVLDLRYNGGGYMDLAIDVLSDFLDGKKKAVITKPRDAAKNEIFYTNESGLLKNIPLAVLVNTGSASASEIVAGAIQDYERGVVIGEKTFGKGSVQIVERLDDGSSLRLTIAKWFTPNDRSIDEVGILPTIAIANNPDEPASDAQLDKAVEYLRNL